MQPEERKIIISERKLDVNVEDDGQIIYEVEVNGTYIGHQFIIHEFRSKKRRDIVIQILTDKPNEKSQEDWSNMIQRIEECIKKEYMDIYK